MKKTVLFALLLALLLSLAACGEKAPAPAEPDPPADVSSEQSNPETPKPAEPAPPTPAPQEPDSPTLAALRTEAANAGRTSAVAFLGTTEKETAKAVQECISASGQWEQYAFLCSIHDDRIIFLGGSEVYCVVPASTDATVSVNSLTYDADGQAVTGDELYTGDGHPVILVCNASDIMPNAIVTVDDGEPIAFSPYISLKDGTLAASGPENAVYPFPPSAAENNTPADPPADTPTAPANGNVIYLTFDDGPSEHTQELLDVLDRYNVKVTFFTTASGPTDMIGEEYRRGHSVGIHTATHDYDKIYASEDAYFEDLDKMSDIIYEQTGTRTKLVRFPGGSSNKVSCFNPGIMTKLTQDVQDRGYQYFDWNVLSGDAGETTDTATVAQNVIDGCTDRENSIVLQHDIKGFSVAAVEQIIQWGLSNGYTFKPLTVDSPSAHHHLNN